MAKIKQVMGPSCHTDYHYFLNTQIILKHLGSVFDFSLSLHSEILSNNASKSLYLKSFVTLYQAGLQIKKILAFVHNSWFFGKGRM